MTNGMCTSLFIGDGGGSVTDCEKLISWSIIFAEEVEGFALNKGTLGKIFIPSQVRNSKNIKI
jgi:alcohol dehydrogenase YqhD (iron-dependent ADH family)